MPPEKIPGKKEGCAVVRAHRGKDVPAVPGLGQCVRRDPTRRTTSCRSIRPDRLSCIWRRRSILQDRKPKIYFAVSLNPVPSVPPPAATKPAPFSSTRHAHHLHPEPLQAAQKEVREAAGPSPPGAYRLSRLLRGGGRCRRRRRAAGLRRPVVEPSPGRRRSSGRPTDCLRRCQAAEAEGDGAVSQAPLPLVLLQGGTTASLGTTWEGLRRTACCRWSTSCGFWMSS
jgi:hypothetical protein